MRDVSPPDRPIERVPPEPLIAEGHAALRRAAESPTELTVALLCFHIAIEQIGRELLAQHPACSPAEREQAWMESLSWGRMLAALQRHGLLSQDLRTTLTRLNDERNHLCHRWPQYRGLVEQIERYAAATDFLSRRVEPEGWVDAVAHLSVIDDINLAEIERSRAAAQPPAPSQSQPDDDFLAQMLAASV
ncbi:MAG: hypothetical protein HGA45_41445 [Chloroflexales bacterium]|nr:hypothetical protein [Chloroflexales bacterium]